MGLLLLLETLLGDYDRQKVGRSKRVLGFLRDQRPAQNCADSALQTPFQSLEPI